MRWLRDARVNFAEWLLRDTRLRGVHFGERSISLSPGGVDVVRWSMTTNAVAAGDLGMNVATGVPNAFIGGVVTPLVGGSQAGAPELAWGNSSIGAPADTRFLDAWYNQATAPTTALSLPLGRAGVLRSLFVRHDAAIGNGNSVVYTVLINGVATTITVTLATGAIAQVSDLVNSAAVAIGDRVDLRAVKALSIGAGGIEVKATLLFAQS